MHIWYSGISLKPSIIYQLVFVRWLSLQILFIIITIGQIYTIASIDHAFITEAIYLSSPTIPPTMFIFPSLPSSSQRGLTNSNVNITEKYGSNRHTPPPKSAKFTFESSSYSVIKIEAMPHSWPWYMQLNSCWWSLESRWYSIYNSSLVLISLIEISVVYHPCFFVFELYNWT